MKATVIVGSTEHSFCYAALFLILLSLSYISRTQYPFARNKLSLVVHTVRTTRLSPAVGIGAVPLLSKPGKHALSNV